MSNAEKRSVSTDALETLGTIITDGGRDAIHLAVEPVVAKYKLYPGQHVGLEDGKASPYAGKLLGIVDPFLKGPVPEGSKFWLVVYPRQITSLRHVWEHPDFNAEVAPITDLREQSRMWLEQFSKRFFSYDHEDYPRFETLISCAEQGSFPTDIEYGDNCQPDNEFWMHFERYTGKTVAHRPPHFRCAC